MVFGQKIKYNEQINDATETYLSGNGYQGSK
jgi:hypothetical protein